jgi:hypothetical protein
VRDIEGGDDFAWVIIRGLHEPADSIKIAMVYRGAGRATGQKRYYREALERIEKAETGLSYNAGFNLQYTIAHANVLREKAAVIRESDTIQGDADAIEGEADRIEKEFLDREKADRNRHQLPGG